MESVNHRIADIIKDTRILNSRLRAGMLDLYLEGGMVLTIYVPGSKLNLRLTTPNGIIEEGLE